MVLQIVMCVLLAISGLCCGKIYQPASVIMPAPGYGPEKSAPPGSKTPLNVSEDRVVLSAPVVNESFWIGAYAEYTTWIKILGCYTIKTIVSAPVHKVTVLETHSVRSCLDFCKGFIYFGLTASSCLCFNGSFSLSDIGRCIPQKCPGTDGDFCGGSFEAVVYQTVSMQYSGLGECLASGYVGTTTRRGVGSIGSGGL
uniref:Uncharacterized protein LOC111118798 n=1 Tax=Crassostrea virginica TaxID=6565 RepID=A0A8B8CI29_CRAVI|nr:uncharacterized protein LOC111118798 [Crassostrea virginica]